MAVQNPGTHMFKTLGYLLEAGGPQSKAVVWAHNSHIGDAVTLKWVWSAKN